MTEVSIYLFGNIAWESGSKTMNQELDMSFCETLKEVGSSIEQRCNKASAALKVLMSNGWRCCGNYDDIMCTHEDIKTAEQAKEALEKLGFDSEEFSIWDDGKEECEDH